MFAQNLSIPAREIPIDIDAIAERIAVHRPYFAFSKLYRLPEPTWDIYGVFTPEQPLGMEHGPICTAEAGRHLAILGSCAAVLPLDSAEGIDSRTYYLAHRARWDMRGAVALPPGTELTARARITMRSRNSVTAHTELLAGDTVLGVLEVSYHVLPSPIFKRKFRKLYVKEESSTFPVASPYTRALPLTFDTPRRHALTSYLKHSGYTHSSGHFADYPTWPVAVVMYGISQSLGELIRHGLPDARAYRIVRADIEATELIPLGAPLTFRSHIEHVAGTTCEVQSVAHAGDEQMATLHATLRLNA